MDAGTLLVILASEDFLNLRVCWRESRGVATVAREPLRGGGMMMMASVEEGEVCCCSCSCPVIYRATICL